MAAFKGFVSLHKHYSFCTKLYSTPSQRASFRRLCGLSRLQFWQVEQAHDYRVLISLLGHALYVQLEHWLMTCCSGAEPWNLKARIKNRDYLIFFVATAIPLMHKSWVVPWAKFLSHRRLPAKAQIPTTTTNSAYYTITTQPSPARSFND